MAAILVALIDAVALATVTMAVMVIVHIKSEIHCGLPSTNVRNENLLLGRTSGMYRRYIGVVSARKTGVTDTTVSRPPLVSGRLGGC
jgi:hypothetical protein